MLLLDVGTISGSVQSDPWAPSPSPGLILLYYVLLYYCITPIVFITLDALVMFVSFTIFCIFIFATLSMFTTFAISPGFTTYTVFMTFSFALRNLVLFATSTIFRD